MSAVLALNRDCISDEDCNLAISNLILSQQSGFTYVSILNEVFSIFADCGVSQSHLRRLTVELKELVIKACFNKVLETRHF